MPEQQGTGQLTDKVCVVTGASSGIGEAIARRFASEGAHVVVAARRKDRLDDIVADIGKNGGRAEAHELDVSDWDAVQAFARTVKDRHGEVDVLVNNAGVMAYRKVEDFPVDEWRRMLDVNLVGAFQVTKALLPLMKPAHEGWRTILNMGSVAGVQGFAWGTGYCASKFGLKGFSESLGLEVAEDGIRVAIVQPGYVATPLHGPGETDEDGVPKAKMARADDLAQICLQLATQPASAYVDEITVYPSQMYAE